MHFDPLFLIFFRKSKFFLRNLKVSPKKLFFISYTLLYVIKNQIMLHKNIAPGLKGRKRCFSLLFNSLRNIYFVTHDFQLDIISIISPTIKISLSFT